jgi:hypothetical protein
MFVPSINSNLAGRTAVRAATRLYENANADGYLDGQNVAWHCRVLVWGISARAKVKKMAAYLPRGTAGKRPERNLG